MKPWGLAYYSTKVQRVIQEWPAGIRADFLHIAGVMVEHGPDLGMPHTRAKGQEGIGRALFCTVVGRRIIILHGFIKKTEQTPMRELDIARARMKEVKP